MKKIVLILTVAIGFPAVTFAQSGKALKLVKGQKYQIENKITTTNSFERQCQSFDNKTEEKYTYICEVAGKEENNYNLLNTITNFRSFGIHELSC